MLSVVLPSAGNQEKVPPRHVQSGKVFLREAVLLVSPLVEVHAVVIRAIDTAQERHAVLGCTVARTHDLAPTTWGCGTINSRNTARGVFSTVICDVQPDDWRLRARWSSLDQYDLGNAAILAKIVV
jgi:hypothetical protein